MTLKMLFTNRLLSFQHEKENVEDKWPSSSGTSPETFWQTGDGK